MLKRFGPSGMFLIALISVLFLNGCAQQSSAPTSESKSSESNNRDEKKPSTSDIPSVRAVTVEQKFLNTDIDLPGELEAYQNVPIHAKVEGFVSWIGVDRGSVVKKGQKMIVISCPELDQKTKEAAARVSAAESSFTHSEAALEGEKANQVQMQSKLDADSLTASRLQQAAKVPGAIAQNEVDLAVKGVEADQARVESEKSSVKAAIAVVASEKNNVQAARDVHKSLEAMSAYLQILAPFDGVITERNVHEGSIVAVDSSRGALPLVRIQQKSLLRLVVAVPEALVAGVHVGDIIKFSVPAFLGRDFQGDVARLGFALDQKTRTMPVELNVWNKEGVLEPGMFATVKWHATRTYPTLFVPVSAVGDNLKGTYVIKIVDGTAQQVQVERGQSMNGMVEVVGALKPGDQLVLKATDEYKDGSKLNVAIASAADIKAASKRSSAGGE